MRINTKEADRQIRNGNIKTAAFLGGLAAAGVIGQLIFKPKWRKSDALSFALAPVARPLMEQLRLRGMQQLPLSEHSAAQEAAVEATKLGGISSSPDVMVMDAELPNAMAGGFLRRRPRVVVFGDLDKILTKDELLGVLTHEVAHLKNQDNLLIVVGSELQMFAFKTLVTPLLDKLGQKHPRLAYLGGLAAQLGGWAYMVQFMRVREALADSTAAKFSQHPEYLHDALVSLGKTRTDSGDRKLSLKTRILRMIPSFLIDTHPPMQKRLADLDKISGK